MPMGLDRMGLAKVHSIRCGLLPAMQIHSVKIREKKLVSFFMLLVQAIQMVCMSGVRGAKFSVDDVKFSCGDVKEDVVEPSPSMFVGLILTDFFFLFSQPVHSPDRCQRCCWSCV